jgi:phosphoribosylaminoimidazole-succinocarboxamide synthase
VTAPGARGGQGPRGENAPPVGPEPGLRHVYSGKIRELYETPDGVLLLVASDRISAFDYVLETPIPDKGKILTQLSLWWFERLADIVPNHLVDAPVPARFAGRAMACMPLSMVPVECVARGYLTGTGLADYRRDGTVAGAALPAELTDGSRLPEPIFDPDSKAPQGQHDENITMADVAALVGADAAAELARITLAVYQRGADVAGERGIIVADTKIELGFDGSGVLRLADEVLTPDSSRFWPAETWQPGRSQVSFDKQFVRDWLTSPASGWDRHSQEPPPPLPDTVVEQTRETYVAAFERITGLRWR